MIDSSFWRERRVFLTGHTGFKGAWLSLMLERLCARTTGFGLAPATTPSLYDLARAGENLCDVRGDICDAAMLHGALRAADPDIVIHLASRPPRDGATPNMRAVERLKQTGGPDVLDASLGAPSVQAAVFVSTEAAYVSLDWMELTSASDAHVVSLHCPDPIGGGDFAIEKGAEPIRFGAPIHVLDALYGVLLLAERAIQAVFPLPANATSHCSAWMATVGSEPVRPVRICSFEVGLEVRPCVAVNALMARTRIAKTFRACFHQFTARSLFNPL